MFLETREFLARRLRLCSVVYEMLVFVLILVVEPDA
jgi:hypothetical protein